MGTDMVYCWVVKEGMMGVRTNQERRPCVLGEIACKYLARCCNVGTIEYLKWEHYV